MQKVGLDNAFIVQTVIAITSNQKESDPSFVQISFLFMKEKFGWSLQSGY